jgi:tripartite-type tricarboxylate transporter receptor subunit TctC
LVAPAGTDDVIVAQIHKDVVAVLRREDVAQKFRAYGAEPIGNSGPEMAAFLERERELWGGVIEQAKLKASE